MGGKKLKTENILNYLSEGFLRGKTNSNESIIIHNEIRIGVTHVKITLRFIEYFDLNI